MSFQTSLDSYFKCRANIQPAQQKMDNKNKLKRRSLSLTRPHKPNKSPKNLEKTIVGLKTENEVITLSSSSEDLLTPPDRRSNYSHWDISPQGAIQEKILTRKHLDSPNTSTDSSSTIIYSPQIKQQSSQTPIKTPKSPRSASKYFSPTKKRVVTKKSPAKRKLAFTFKENNTQQSSADVEIENKVFSKYQDDKTLFLLSIINKYLKDDSLRHLLHDDAQTLLSNCMKVEELGMRVVCRLYWRQPGWYRAEQLEQIASGKMKISSPDMHIMLKSLVENNLITSAHCEGCTSMDFNDYVKLLKRPELLQICKELKLKMQSKQDAVEALRKFCQSSAISNFFTGKMGNNKDRVLKISIG